MDTKDATTDNKKENIAIPIGLVVPSPEYNQPLTLSSTKK